MSNKKSEYLKLHERCIELENHVDLLVEIICRNLHSYDILKNVNIYVTLECIKQKPIEEILREYE